jgi:CBS domain containing-hemolysin-like protein
MSLVQRWMSGLRKLLIDYLRPGRDEQELLAVIGRAEAVLSDDQRSMLERLIEMHDMRVRELMVPRSDIHAVTVDTPLDQVERVLIETGVSRMPVLDGDIDHVLGIVHVRDVVMARLRGESPSLRSLLRPCLRVLELEQVSGLLSEMRAHSCQIAIVLDEYGGTAGLITLPDLVHEIIGEIGEDGEEEESELRPLGDGSFMVQARMHIEELCEALDISVPQGDFDTVGGWLTAHLGRIPHSGESIRLAGLQVQVVEADPRRISRVRIQRLSDKQS